MRKPRDFDAELDALDQKARTLRQRKIMQLGELVIASGADALPIEMLAGALLAAVASKDDATRAGWSRAGEAMFRAKAIGPSRRLEAAQPDAAANRSTSKPLDACKGTNR